MLVAVGLDPKEATVQDRVALALAGERLGATLAAWAGLDGVDEVVVVSTGARIEAYAAARFPAAAAASLRLALERRAGRALPLFELHGVAALRHLARAVARLEPAVLGEPHVAGEVEAAFASAAATGTAGRELSGALSVALRAAGRILAETAAGDAGATWGHAVAALVEKVLGPLRGRQVLVLGAGERAGAAARHLAEQGARLTVLAIDPGGAEALAREVGGRHGPLDGVGAALEPADVVISTERPPEALGPAAVRRLLARRRRPLVVVDLAAPRAVPAELGTLEDVYLCDADDLGRLHRAAEADRAAAVAAADRIVDEEVAAFAAARSPGAAGEAAPRRPSARRHGLGQNTHTESAPR